MASSKGAAGARRSAIAERARLHAEWAALKCSDSPDVLRGVVALVDVGEGNKAIALRAALAALGATVAPEWSPLVTHVVWTSDGSRSIRALARSLAARVVSPLWVEACAAAARRLPERAFPTGARASDLPSPRALRQMLREAEKENLPLRISLSDTTNTNTQEKQKQPQTNKQKWRISSDHENSTDQSRDQSGDQSRERSPLPSRVNTLPRRALPLSIGTPDKLLQKKSKRKLFTYKEDKVAGTSSSDDEGVKVSVPKPSLPSQKVKRKQNKMAAVSKTPTTKALTYQAKKDLERAERMARRLAATPKKTVTQGVVIKNRIVLTGMSRCERASISEAIRQLNGRLQKEVNRKTTHVILGSCRDERNTPLEDITGIQPLNELSYSERNANCTKATYGDSRVYPALTGASKDVLKRKDRTLHALEGAARGCRVVTTNWVRDSVKEGKWLHPEKYEVPHLRKLSLRARIERSALGRLRKEYAYDVFNGTKVHLSEDAEQRDAAAALVRLCGGRLVEGGGDVTVGVAPGQINSKWVFDSVAAARPRTLRRYIVPSPQRTQDDEIFVSIDSSDTKAG